MTPVVPQFPAAEAAGRLRTLALLYRQLSESLELGANLVDQIRAHIDDFVEAADPQEVDEMNLMLAQLVGNLASVPFQNQVPFVVKRPTEPPEPTPSGE